MAGNSNLLLKNVYQEEGCVPLSCMKTNKKIIPAFQFQFLVMAKGKLTGAGSTNNAEK